MDRRFIIFIVLSIVIIYGWQFLYQDKQSVKSNQPIIEESGSKISEKIDLNRSEKDRNEKIILNNSAIIEEKIVKLSKKDVSIEATTLGAKIKHIYLTYYKSDDKKEEKVDLIDRIPENNQNLALSMLINDQKFDFNNKSWSVEKNQNELIFSISPADKLTIYKKITLNDDNTGEISIKIENNSDKIIKFSDVSFGWGPGIKDEDKQFNVKQIVVLVGRKLERYKPKKKFQSNTHNLDQGYVGMIDQYNCALFYDKNKNIQSTTVNQYQDKTLGLTVNLNNEELVAYSEKEYAVNFYFGFQNYEKLKELGINAHKIVDFGWFRFLSVPMYHTLNFFYDVTKNYGLAIILLTILIRGLLWWPTHRSQTSMKKMQTAMSKMQPRLKTLKEVYKDNPQKLNEETMKLYKEYQINPMGGCLPMLLMMPVLFAMFSIMRSAVELRGAPFFWVWQDLSIKDPTYILPITMGLSMFIQQKISTPPAATPEAATQQKMMLYLMPVMLTFFSFMWPSGLLLYWVVSNILSIGQQLLINRKV